MTGRYIGNTTVADLKNNVTRYQESMTPAAYSVRTDAQIADGNRNDSAEWVGTTTDTNDRDYKTYINKQYRNH